MINQNKLFIGKKIKEQRKRLKLTQFQLAEKVGLHEKQISRIEAGYNHPTFDNFVKIIDVLNLGMSDFDFNQQSNHSPVRDELRFIIDNAGEKDLKIYLDLIVSLKKNL